APAGGILQARPERHRVRGRRGHAQGHVGHLLAGIPGPHLAHGAHLPAARPGGDRRRRGHHRRRGQVTGPEHRGLRERQRPAGDVASSAADVELQFDNRVFWGSTWAGSLTTAALRAVASAVNRAYGGGAVEHPAITGSTEGSRTWAP